MGRYTLDTETVEYPHGREEEDVWRYDANAEPECDRCEDRGRWIGPSGEAEPCPDCGAWLP